MAIMPYDYIAEGTPETGILNVPTPLGEELGREAARLAARSLERIYAACPDAPRPCVECAFVADTFPNRCLPTVANALKCVVEREPFDCHMADRRCAGWLASVADSITLEQLEGENLRPQSDAAISPAVAI